VSHIVECRGYGVTLTPWACLENQLSPMCLPGWPCESCETAVGVAVTPPLNEGKVMRAISRKPSSYDRKSMSRAVARSLGLI